MRRERVWEGLPVETLIHDAAMFAASGVAERLRPTRPRKRRTARERKGLDAIEEKAFPVIEQMMRTLVEEVMLSVVESETRKN